MIEGYRAVFSEEEINSTLEMIKDALQRGHVVQGPYVEIFEKEFGEFVGREAVAVSSGTAALEIAARYMASLHPSVHPEDDIILVPSMTYAATAMAFLNAGLRVRLVDAVPWMTQEDFEANVDEHTYGACVVHLGGSVYPDLDRMSLIETGDLHGMFFVEDCAQAFGCFYKGRHVGLFGDVGCFSLFGTKPLTAGEGGFIVSFDPGVLEEARLARQHGKVDQWTSKHDVVGSNWRMSELNAALGLVGLRNWPMNIAKRWKLANVYYEKLDKYSPPLALYPSKQMFLQQAPNFYKFVVMLPDGVDVGEVVAGLLEEDIKLSGPIYNIPLHEQPVFRYGWPAFDEHSKVLLDKRGEYIKTDAWRDHHICLPVHLGMTVDDAALVADSLIKALKF